MYNYKLGIHFKFNPTMQCILGQFEGWQLVMSAFTDSRQLKTDDPIRFSYSSPSQFNKLVKYIKKAT